LSEVGPQPEARLDQLTGLRVILAPGRADRPIDFAPAEHGPPSPGECPFCEGNEGKTPAETWADRPDGPADGTGWRVRAVPNLYPVLSDEEHLEADRVVAESGLRDPLLDSGRQAGQTLFTAAVSEGQHEVVIHCPTHERTLASLDSERLALAVAGWRQRVRALADQAAYVQLIVNEGPDAGASLEHSHAQVYAFGFVPPMVARERERFRTYAENTGGGDLLAEILSEEIRLGERLVAIDDDAALLCPWASRSPYELRIVPRSPSARFELDEGVGLGMLELALSALRARFGHDPQLNLWVRTAPRGAEPFHWHLDIAPRLAIKAGLELSTGLDVNILAPERAASELREALGAET